MAVPYTFGSATSAIPLSQLDSNFATGITLGNTAIQLGNTVTTLNNMTFNNVTITSSTVNGLTLTNATLTNANITSVAVAFPNSFLANSSVTLGNTALTLGSTVTSVGNLTLTNVTISSGNVTATISNSTISNTTVSNAVSDSVNITGFMGIPQNSQNGNYGLVLADAGKHIYHPSGQAAATYTIPANSNIGYTTGTAITIVNGSANNVTVAITTDTMYLSSNGATGSRTLAQYGIATALKVTSNVWVISGSGLT